MGAANAGHLAAEMLALADAALRRKLRERRQRMAAEVVCEHLQVAEVSDVRGAKRTEPVTIPLTFNSWPISRSDFLVPTYRSAEVRGTTRREWICARRVINSSVTPSAK